MVEIKKYDTVNFSYIFYYAKDKFDIELNPANDMFFDSGALTYKGYNVYHISQTFDDTNISLEDEITKESLRGLSDYQKSSVIIGSFMKDHNLEQLLILNK